MASLFDDLFINAARRGLIAAQSQDARDWFRNQAKSTTTLSSTKILNDSTRKVERPEVGGMYFFRYEPKMKQKLPYFDRFPLIFMVQSASGGFHGINLHYLPPRLRARLMDSLYDLKTDKRYDERTKINISYSILKGVSKYKWFKPTYKHYLTNHIQSKFIEIPSNEWDIAMMLPVAEFSKATTQKIYSDSRRKI